MENVNRFVPTRFLLAVGDPRKLESMYQETKHWFWFIVVNATLESRRHLSHFLTDRRVLPMAWQYILGKNQFTPDMFDRLPRFNMEKPDTNLHNLGVYLFNARIPSEKGHELVQKLTDYPTQGDENLLDPQDQGGVDRVNDNSQT